MYFPVQWTGGSPTGPDPKNSVGDEDNGSQGRPVWSGLQVPGEPGHFRTRTRPLWWNSNHICFSKCTSIASVDISNDPYWHFGSLEDNQWGGCRPDSKKLRGQLFERIIVLGNFWVGLSRFAATPLIAAPYPVLCDIDGFHLWSPIATGKYLDCPGRIPNVAQTTATGDVSDPRSSISEHTSRREKKNNFRVRKLHK